MGDRLEIRRTVIVSLRNAAAFIDVYYNSGNLGGIITPLSSRLAVGEECELEVHFEAEAKVFHTRGVARWRRTGSQKNLPAGVGVDLASTERRTRDLLLDFAKGRPITLVDRAQPRFPVRLEVTYKNGSVQVTEFTDNLSVGGCFVRTMHLPTLGAALELKLKPPGFLLGITVEGVVVWHQTQLNRGFGVRFSELKRGTRKKLEELMERIQRQLEDEHNQPL